MYKGIINHISEINLLCNTFLIYSRRTAVNFLALLDLDRSKADLQLHTTLLLGHRVTSTTLLDIDRYRVTSTTLLDIDRYHTPICCRFSVFQFVVGSLYSSLLLVPCIPVCCWFSVFQFVVGSLYSSLLFILMYNSPGRRFLETKKRKSSILKLWVSGSNSQHTTVPGIHQSPQGKFFF